MLLQHARDAVYRPAERRFDIRELTRAGAWALVALAAVTIATVAASTPRGEDRLILAVSNLRGVPPPERLTRTPAEVRARNEARQLAEAVRNLSENRDRVLARLDSLERNVGDISSSIRTPKPAPIKPAPASPPDPAPSPVVAAPVVAAPVIAEPVVAAPVTVPLPTPAPEAATDGVRGGVQTTSVEDPTAPTKTEFGIDLGRANNIEGLHQLWMAAKSRHGAALDGLRPIMSVRQPSRSGGIELRLVLGPIPNAATAARLCASLAGQTCHPTVFDGQRLASR